jgi:bifunctional UDP-N-acetylglucosamine pyrophosphorylase / glucosamine-1-phosphate N-acetyltransferase
MAPARRKATKRPLAVVILAAGKGTRFKSQTAKVLHPILGRPMLDWVISASAPLKAAETVVVTGNDGASVRAAAEPNGWKVRFATQREQLGTAHALKAGLTALKGFEGDVLVLCGDTPLISPEILSELLELHKTENDACALLTACIEDPTGYGRIIRHPTGHVDRIVEERDANDAQRAINEINAGIYVFDCEVARAALRSVKRNNDQNEEYLPDVIGILTSRNLRVHGLRADPDLMAGVNDRFQLAEAEAVLARRVARAHAINGVTIIDPATVRIEPSVQIAADAVIGPDVSLHGETKIGFGTRIQRAVIHDSVIGNDCEIGPFAYLRPGVVLADKAKVGTYVEVKNSQVGAGSKVPHLSYVGDTTIGEGVNVGAATVTVNYDGETKIKARTVIKDGAKIGSDTMLIAPVTVGKKAATGAGAVVTKDVPDGTLVVGNPAKPLRKTKMTASKGEKGKR